MTKQIKQEVLTFLGLTALISSVFYILIIRSGSLMTLGGIFVLLLMWSPAAAAFITRRIYKIEWKTFGWKIKDLKYMLLAYVLPLLYAFPVYALVWVFGLGRLDLSGPVGGWQIASMATLGVAGSCLSALGEEIGWRGFLVPRLADLFGFTKASLFSGLIWAAWHTPLILFADYNSGSIPSWYALACFLVMVVGASFSYAWLRLKSGSLWPAVLLHAAHNAFIQSVFDLITVDTGRTLWFTGEFGIGLALTLAIVGLIFWRLGVRDEKTLEVLPA